MADNKLPKADSNVGGYLVGNENGKTVLHEDGNKGGLFVGRSHAEKGGIQAVNTDTNQNLLVEGKEAQIIPAATKSNETHTFEGKTMTNKGVLSAVNQSGGGVPIAKKGAILDERKGQPIQLPASSIIITKPAVADKTLREFDGVPRTNLEILSIINKNAGGCELTEESAEMMVAGREYAYGGKIMKDYEITSSCGCSHHNQFEDGGKVLSDKIEKAGKAAIKDMNEWRVAGKFTKEDILGFSKMHAMELAHEEAKKHGNKLSEVYKDLYPKYTKEIEAYVLKNDTKYAIKRELFDSVFPKLWDSMPTDERINLIDGWHITSNTDFQPYAFSELPEDVKNNLYYAFAKAGSKVTEKDKEEIEEAVMSNEHKTNKSNVKKHADGGAVSADDSDYDKVESVDWVQAFPNNDKIQALVIKYDHGTLLRLLTIEDDDTAIYSNWVNKEVFAKEDSGKYSKERVRNQVIELLKAGDLNSIRKHGLKSNTLGTLKYVDIAPKVEVAHQPIRSEKKNNILSMDGYYFIDKTTFQIKGQDGKEAYQAKNLVDAILWCKGQIGYKIYSNDIPDLVKSFMPVMQQKAIIGTNESWDELRHLYNIISTMPKTYETDGIVPFKKVVYLHYFYGGSDWYIVEKDSEDEQLQAFGYTILNGDLQNAEWGYVSIEELKATNKIELDFHFNPIKFSDLMENEHGLGEEKNREEELVHSREEIATVAAASVAESNVPSVPAVSNGDNNKAGAFRYGAGGYNVPLAYSRILLSELSKRGFTILSESPNYIMIDINNNGHVLLVNDSGGEFNMIDEGTGSHVANTAYDINSGFVAPFKLAKDIEAVYYAHFNISRDAHEVKAEEPKITERNINATTVVVNATDKVTSKKQAEINNAVKDLVREKGSDRTKYSADDIALLKLWSGSGSLAKQGERGTGLLDQFFTPADIVSKMWGLALKHGFKFNGANILEPCVGVGRFFANIPKDIPVNVVGYDIDEVAVTICKVLYPQYDIHHASFESMFFTGRRHIGLAGLREKFDLVITNPPYRPYVSEYAPLGEKDATGADTFEMYFIMRGVDVLKKGGLLIMIIPNTFMSNNKKYNEFKEKLAKKADLIDAYRLPNGVFPNTNVGTDIIVLRRKGDEKNDKESTYETGLSTVAKKLTKYI